jgi:hypothetical protein
MDAKIRGGILLEHEASPSITERVADFLRQITPHAGRTGHDGAGARLRPVGQTIYGDKAL